MKKLSRSKMKSVLGGINEKGSVSAQGKWGTAHAEGEFFAGARG